VAIVGSHFTRLCFLSTPSPIHEEYTIAGSEEMNGRDERKELPGYEGTSVVRTIWSGRANIIELEVDGPAGHVEGVNLRLYNPQSRQWSLNFANCKAGTMSVPTVGEFKNGRGEFFDISWITDQTRVKDESDRAQ
jgi:hypothetical protein